MSAAEFATSWREQEEDYEDNRDPAVQETAALLAGIAPTAEPDGKDPLARKEIAALQDAAGVNAAAAAADSAVEFSQDAPPDLELAALRDPNLRIAKPFAVNFHREEGQVIAVAAEVTEHGVGANESEATQDLQHALAGLYHSLQEDQEILGPGLQETWQKIQEHIQPRTDEDAGPIPENFRRIYETDLAAARFAPPPAEEFNLPEPVEHPKETDNAQEVRAALFYQMSNALQERWPETAGLPASYSALQTAFQSQEFSSPEEFRQEAAAIAQEATAFFQELPEGHPARAGLALLQGQLTKYLTTAPESEVNAYFDMTPTEKNLQDTLKAMALWVDSPAEQPLDFADLTRQGMANAVEQNGYTYRWELPQTSIMLYAAANFQTALEAMQVKDLSDLNPELSFDQTMLNFHPDSPANALPWPVQRAYANLLEGSMDDVRLLHANAVGNSIVHDRPDWQDPEVHEAIAAGRAGCLRRFQDRAAARWELNEQLSAVIADQIHDGSAAGYPERPDYSGLSDQEFIATLKAKEEQAQARWTGIQAQIAEVVHPLLQETIAGITRLMEHPNFNPSGWDDEMTEMEVLLDLDRRWQEKQGPAAVQQVQERQREWQEWHEDYLS